MAGSYSTSARPTNHITSRQPGDVERTGDSLSEPPPRKLLFLVQSLNYGMGGAENCAVQLNRALSERGYDVHVLAHAGRLARRWHAGRSRSRLDEIILSNDWDLVIDWGLFSSLSHVYRLGNGCYREYLRRSCWAHRAPLRWTKYGRFALPNYRRRLAHESKLLQRSDAWYLANSGMGARMAADEGVDRSRLQVIYNGVDTELLDPQTTRTVRGTMRASLGLNDGHVVCLFVAHNIVLKNIALLRRVFDRLYAKNRRVRLVVIGKRRPRFRAPYLIYAGRTTEMQHMYAVGDLLVHPSCFDPFGNVVLEAMSSGLPVVCSTWTGIGETIDDGKQGFTLSVAGRASDAWVNVLSHLISDQTMRRQMGSAARQHACRFDYHRHVDRIECFLAEAYHHVGAPAAGCHER